MNWILSLLIAAAGGNAPQDVRVRHVDRIELVQLYSLFQQQPEFGGIPQWVSKPGLQQWVFWEKCPDCEKENCSGERVVYWRKSRDEQPIFDGVNYRLSVAAVPRITHHNAGRFQWSSPIVPFDVIVVAPHYSSQTLHAWSDEDPETIDAQVHGRTHRWDYQPPPCECDETTRR